MPRSARSAAPLPLPSRRSPTPPAPESRLTDLAGIGHGTTAACRDASGRSRCVADAGGQLQTFVLNQKLISLTGDLWIEDGKGNHAFEVDGKLLSMHGTHVLKDLNGQPLYEISKPLAPHVHKTIEIKKDGHTAATVQEAIFHLGGDKFKITLAGGQELTVHGNWSNREFQVKDQAGGWS
jgi:uncharacterized protein YxjI